MNAHALLLAALLSSPVLAQDPQQWVLHTVRGERLTGRPHLDADATVMRVAGEDGERSVPVDELQRMEHAVDTTDLDDRVRRIWLRSGVELPLSSISGTGREFVGGISFASEPLSMPLPYIAALRLSEDDEVETDFESQLAEPGESTDYLYLLDGDKTARVSATVTGFQSGDLIIELGGQEREVPWDRLYGVIFARDSGAAPDAQPNPRVRVALRHDARLEGRLLSLGESAQLRLDEGPTLRIAASKIASINFATDKLIYLSDLEPSNQEQTPAIDRVWPWLKDRSPAGDAILLGGKVFEKGLVLFPRTRLTYDLQGRYDVFEAVIGIEDRGGPQAHAVFRIVADDKVVFESDPFVLGKEPQSLRIPVPQVRRLTLEADFGENLDLGDHCVFADAKVVRS